MLFCVSVKEKDQKILHVKWMYEILHYIHITQDQDRATINELSYQFASGLS